MKTLIIALAGASALLGASSASAQPYHNNWDHRGWHDRAWHDRGWHSDWRYDHRYHYGRPYYGYGHRTCAWRYGERVCW